MELTAVARVYARRLSIPGARLPEVLQEEVVQAGPESLAHAYTSAVKLR